MARKIRTTFLYIAASIVFCAAVYHHHLRNAAVFPSDQIPPTPIIASTTTTTTPDTDVPNLVVHENLVASVAAPPQPEPFVAPSPPSSSSLSHSTVSILMPDWDVLVIVSAENSPALEDSGVYYCLFELNEVSPAKFSGVLPLPNRSTFTCILPVRARRRFPFKQPLLVKSSDNPPRPDTPPPALLRWSYLVYDSLKTDEDVILFVKGVNTRQGTNRDPEEFRCLFGDSVKTTVKTSMQEVFRCRRPDDASLGGGKLPTQVSLEIVGENRVIPSVAYYTPPRTLKSSNGKSLLCATTMVYNVAKSLREWVLYHSQIGVEKFILYDNGSDDDLHKVVKDLADEGFDISTYSWLWPKTQESGFSHAAVYAAASCKWMAYIDVDEFVYSPSWAKSSQPSKSMLQSLVSPSPNSSHLGQIQISCYEFGPSNQEFHPVMGVTQGYDCRRWQENRHKSIVLLDAIDPCLVNAIHHFNLSAGFGSKKVMSDRLAVNHYKYQAWPEFKAKFRRRVSAYVLDWTQRLNPDSNDRAPGLGFSPVEPKGWSQMFCETRDDRLKNLTWKWFGRRSGSGESHMTWQRTSDSM